MRYLAILITWLFLAMALAVIPRSASSANGADVRSEATVSLAVAEGGRQSTASPLHVIIENTSGLLEAKPQSHFDESNSWGYYNLTLQWTDAEGHTGAVSKVPVYFTVNYLSTTVLQPGEALVRDISFDPKIWQGWPTITNPTTLTVKVTYRSTGEPQFSGSTAGWMGTVVSKAQTVVILPPAVP